jgi:hypothetical protein
MPGRERTGPTRVPAMLCTAREKKLVSVAADREEDMQRLYIVGGQQREPRPLLALPTWYEYHKGLVLEIERETGQAQTRLEYVSPPEVRAEGTPPVLFKCASLENEHLYLCTHSEILVYAVPSFERVAYITLPCFNDLHHVRPTPEGTLVVADTGLDAVLEVTLDGQLVREWAVLGGSIWDRFSRDVDYRKIASTKPHAAHPNNVFFAGGELWVTRFEQKDAICLTAPERRIEIGVERLHDGVAQGDYIYFTSVKGDVVVANARTLKVEQVVDLARFHPEGTLLGWCRGLMLDGDNVWIGFSHIRPTKFRENIGWVANRFRRSQPTHLGCYDLAAGRYVGEIELESHGVDAVFSILAAPNSEAS